MGCDGGTIPRRDELVRTKKKAEAKDKDSERAFHWRYCHLSQQLLQAPIVMCGLGYLYSKVALIEGLLSRDSLPENTRHVRSLKDVKDLNLTPNPEYKPDEEKKEGGLDVRAAPYYCPVIGLEMSGKYRFVGLWSCGCVFSERALREISTNVCHKCQQPFEDKDVVILNGNEEDVAAMQTNMELRQQKNKKKKDKKIKTETSESETKPTEAQQPTAEPKPSTSETKQSASETKQSTSETKEVKPSTSVGKNGIKSVNGAIEKNAPVKRSGDSLKERVKKVKSDYSVAKDPHASDVYKSLFTSHQSEQQQNRAHWITYNPFYN